VTDETASEQITSATFRALSPPPAPELRFLGATISARSFFPLHRDGYRDAVVVTFMTNLKARVTLTIRNRSGRVVRRVQLGTLRGRQRHTWKWTGRLRRGSRAAPGRYTIRVSARRGARLVHARPLHVRVRTGWQARRGVRALWGRQYAGLQMSGNCAHRIRQRDLLMACVGRGTIIASYRFRLPRTTFAVRGYKGKFLYGVYVGKARRVVQARGWHGPRTYEVRVGISQTAGRTGVIVVGAALTYLYRVRV
jgi:FlgD Ig-like domain